MATTFLKCYRPFLPFQFPSKSSIIDKRMFIRNSVLVRSFHSKLRFRCFCSTTTVSNSHSESKPLIDESGNSKESANGLQLWLYNTMSRQKELFKPKESGKVGMYVCGVTAYDLSHIGHARVYVSFDVLYRLSFSSFLAVFIYLCLNV